MIDVNEEGANQIFCTADLHLDHYNVIRYCSRPFSSIKHQQEVLINNWNNVVPESGTTFIVGDLWFNVDDVRRLFRILNKLNGRKILILGNHDNIKPFTYVNHGIESVHTSLMLNKEITGFSCSTYLAHDPAVYTALPFNSFMICGHVHDLFKQSKGCINCGVDVWDYKPVNIKILYEMYLDYIGSDIL